MEERNVEHQPKKACGSMAMLLNPVKCPSCGAETCSVSTKCDKKNGPHCLYCCPVYTGAARDMLTSGLAQN